MPKEMGQLHDRQCFELIRAEDMTAEELTEFDNRFDEWKTIIEDAGVDQQTRSRTQYASITLFTIPFGKPTTSNSASYASPIGVV